MEDPRKTRTSEKDFPLAILIATLLSATPNYDSLQDQSGALIQDPPEWCSKAAEQICKDDLLAGNVLDVQRKL